ncbi:hypothetical protein FACS1894106_4430 [Spirochaetia bacterium]|nr:hypothetical protein FACS1894106_4430 [Spirochaetia bacterium]
MSDTEAEPITRSGGLLGRAALLRTAPPPESSVEIALQDTPPEPIPEPILEPSVEVADQAPPLPEPGLNILPPAAVQPQDIHVLGVKDLHKKFGRKEVVRGVNFSMNNGEVAGLLGPNGAGKTTIFYMIVGFYHPSAGLVTMDDMDITAKPMYLRARQGIAYLPQEASIFRKLTVEQNIWAILESRRDINKSEKKERLEFLLDEFGIGRLRKQFGFTLSGGGTAAHRNRPGPRHGTQVPPAG